jgi:hypothetical protein
MPDHSYAWVLGAGASRSSGIPLAGELVQRWLSELHRRLDRTGTPLPEWATAENLGIPKFEYKNAASFYSRLYERRFGDNPDEGFAYLETLMTGKDPSPGYSILAQILDRTPHKVVISTNFDNLVADALSIYTTTFPLVIGHESLANFVRVVSRRPIICKIHRDLLLGPKNDHRSLRRLHESWAAALRSLFSQYTPCFIGYGGNDDSLMDLLESLDPGDIKGQLIWCYHERYEPSDRIAELVEQHRGALVPVPDFDMLMVQIGDKMKIEPIDDAIEKRATERARKYREQLIKLDTTTYPEVRRILRGAFERAGGTLAWIEKIGSETSTARRKQFFEQALEQYPDNLELQLRYANFLGSHRIDLEQCRARFEQLRPHDEELDYRPSCWLANLYILLGRLDDAKALLMTVPPNLSAPFAAKITERCEDYASAEALFQLAGEQELIQFLYRQGRFDECSFLLEGQRGNPDLAVTAAYFQWIRCKDPVGARRMLTESFDLESADGDQREALVIFTMLNDDLEAAAAAIAKLDSMPKFNWWSETTASVLGLFHALRLGNVDQDRLESVRQLFALSSYPTTSTFRSLVELAEALSPKLSKPHRKFVIDLAKAYYDPSLRTGLNVYEQWRRPVD